ncbi:MAG: hypothetical protein J6A25_00780 [Lachnospiraceae bacterium]|nr:hypothetical protein [Lachnospiraceae bacterium]
MKKKFGKIENGIFIQAPKNIKGKKFNYFNPRDEKYIEYGYFEVKEDNYPTDGQLYKPVYIQKDTYILQSWEIMSEEDITEQESIKNNTLEARISLIEEQMAFLMEYGKFRKPWQEHKYHNKDK